uniref:protein CYR61-like n=1 Tax=Ciona intestinalis TaxID=7719 RepID=UPI000EF55211|nr:protein CYR61-like [Ciona intestinalis]|eukprot:XP_026691731.1 protein CYR61-like [Ciona intestinalis]
MRSTSFLIYSLSLVAAFLHFVSIVNGMCPLVCDCSNAPTRCPSGVSLVTDGCNCCKVCAKQTGEECNDQEKVCDPHRDLFCDYSGSRSGDWGVCRAQDGRPCVHEGTRISSGTMFQPTCKLRCWCMDGADACTSLCPHEIQVPLPHVCPHARLQPIPGQCCSAWVCDAPSGESAVLPMDRFWNEYVSEHEPTDISSSVLPLATVEELGSNVADDVVYESDGGPDGDEIIDYQLRYVDSPQIDVGDEDSWSETNLIPGEGKCCLIIMNRINVQTAFKRTPLHPLPFPRNCEVSIKMRTSIIHGCSSSLTVDMKTSKQSGCVLKSRRNSRAKFPQIPTSVAVVFAAVIVCAVSTSSFASSVTRGRSLAGNRKSGCRQQASMWSYCTKSCGLGVSTRVSNANAECKLRREVRLCEVRSCNQEESLTPKHGRRCMKQRRAPRKEHIVYSGCTSVRSYRPRHCGLCKSEDRCCTPRSTRTTTVRFECEDGRAFYKRMMVIKSCKCHRHCTDVMIWNGLPGSHSARSHLAVDS